MKQPPGTLVFFLTGCLLVSTQVQSQTTEKQQLYIGIEKNRSPYTSLDDKQQAHGVLVATVRRLCQTIKAECHFIVDNFDKLIHDLQTYNLHGLVVIDTVMLPEIDKLRLTSPLCKIQPVFIQNKNNKRTKKEDFKQTTIGVLEGSLLHFYLLDEYSSHARLKPYPLLESGLFDLYFGKIDALFTNQAFFNERVLKMKTTLGRKNNTPMLIALQANETRLPVINTTLALKERDTTLYASLEKAIQADDQLPDCAELLDTNNAETVAAKADDRLALTD